MKHFMQVGILPVAPLLDAAARHAARFNDETWRESYPGSPHADSRSIYLRMPPTISVDSVFNSLEVVDRPIMAERAFSEACSAIALMVGTPLARAMIVSLAPNGLIAPHADEGLYAEATERYHLAILSNPKARLKAGEETLRLRPGVVWWFDKHVTHSGHNLGEAPRIHLIVDVFRAINRNQVNLPPPEAA